MGQALYRKHRPYTLDEIKGQDHITTTLKNALKLGRISHAYLFTGPRGVGKTSIARILAHQINNIEYSSKSPKNHLDIIEIDAASNRRIDEIRDLREKARISPAAAKFKVYIIDEAHMLTKEAFNALLKTLEEPPAHVVFILATTEAHKLPETIISRTQRFTFKPISTEDLVKQLTLTAKHENIEIEPEAIEMIAKHGRGSFRDSISLLDQISSADKKVSVDTVKRTIGYAPDSLIIELIQAIKDKNIQQIFRNLDEANNQGVEYSNIANSLSENLREMVVNKDLSIPIDTALWILDQLVEVPSSYDPSAKLEIILAEATTKFDTKSVPTPVAEAEQQIEAPVPPAKPVETQTESPPKDQPPKTSAPTGDMWQDVLGALKGRHNTLYGVARMANPVSDKDTLTLTFKHDFHRKRCSESKNQTIIQGILAEHGHDNIKLEFIVDKNSKSESPQASIKPKDESDTLDKITSVFGGGEILDE